MTMIYRLSKDAQADLLSIRRYTLEKWGSKQSKKYLQEIQKAIELLAEFPFQGVAKPDLGKHVRSYFYAKHALYYYVKDEQLVIFAVLHRRMLPTAHLASRDR